MQQTFQQFTTTHYSQMLKSQEKKHTMNGKRLGSWGCIIWLKGKKVLMLMNFLFISIRTSVHEPSKAIKANDSIFQLNLTFSVQEKLSSSLDVNEHLPWWLKDWRRIRSAFLSCLELGPTLFRGYVYSKLSWEGKLCVSRTSGNLSTSCGEYIMALYWVVWTNSSPGCENKNSTQLFY